MFGKNWRQVMISQKCPRCYKEIPGKDRFCIYCGQDLSAPVAGTEQQAVPATYRQAGHTAATPSQTNYSPASTQSAPTHAAPAHAAPVRKTGYCPNGHDIDDPSLGFCVICGSPLVDEPVSRRR